MVLLWASSVRYMHMFGRLAGIQPYILELGHVKKNHVDNKTQNLDSINLFILVLTTYCVQSVP